MFRLITILIASIALIGCNEEAEIEDNLITFAKVYGYVKYFHPSDEATQIDWQKFSIYGATQISNCKSKEEIVNTLSDLFKPIAPSIVFSTDSVDCVIDEIMLTPADTTGCHITFWQHQGVSIGMAMNNQVYISQRTYRNGEAPLFEYEPSIGESITKEIADGIWCNIPIAVYCDSQFTYPVSDHEKLEELMEELESVRDPDPENLFVRLGNSINAYNVFQHFYPYFDVVEVDLEDELRKALTKSKADSTARDHLITLEQFTAPLKDGHIGVYNENSAIYFVPPISWEWIEDKLIITKYSGDIDPISVGDEVTKIDGENPKDHFENIYSRISAGTVGWLKYKANEKSLQGERSSKISLEINGATSIELERYINPYRQDDNDTIARYRHMGDGIWYLNLDVIEMDTINALMSELEQSKAIICDLRGYPNGNHDFIRHFMSVNDTSKSWMQIPQIIYPDHKKVVGYSSYNWMEFMKPKNPYLGDKNIVFIIDGRAISYAESYMGFVEGYELATIIGQPTAGTNGNVNMFRLPGGYRITWTGMKVLKHDGSQHHGIGILPEIYVEKTIQGVKDGRDEFLEKALELVMN